MRPGVVKCSIQVSHVTVLCESIYQLRRANERQILIRNLQPFRIARAVKYFWCGTYSGEGQGTLVAA